MFGVRFLLVLAIFLLGFANGWAVTTGGERMEADFRTGSIVVHRADGLTSMSEMRLGPGVLKAERGLIQVPGGEDRTVLLPVMETGLVGRELRVCGINVTATGDGLTSASLEVSMRYSTTGELWSEWQPVPYRREFSQEDGLPVGKWASRSDLTLRVPAEQTNGYFNHFQDWGQFSGDNIDVYLQYLKDYHPHVLQREAPLIRMIQLRVELRDAAVLQTMAVRTGWAVSGIKQ